MKFKKFGKALLMSALSAGAVLSVTSCVQSYTVGFLYVTGTVTAQTSGNGIISGFKIDHNTGNLVPINGLPVASGGKQRFLLKPLPHAGQSLCLGSEDLYGDRPLEPLVEGVEDACHPTLPEQPADAVPPRDDTRCRARLHPCCVPPPRRR